MIPSFGGIDEDIGLLLGAEGVWDSLSKGTFLPFSLYPFSLLLSFSRMGAYTDWFLMGRVAEGLALLIGGIDQDNGFCFGVGFLFFFFGFQRSRENSRGQVRLKKAHSFRCL